MGESMEEKRNVIERIFFLCVINFSSRDTSFSVVDDVLVVTVVVVVYFYNGCRQTHHYGIYVCRMNFLTFSFHVFADPHQTFTEKYLRSVWEE